MNKNVIKVVALALVVSGASTLTPTGLNLGTKAVYAASNSDDITSLKLETNGGGSIRIYDDNDYKSDNKVDSNDLEPDIQYYAKTGSKKIKVKISGVDDEYVRVFTNDSDSSKGQKINKTISLDSGTNKIIVRVYGGEQENNPKYRDDGNKINDYIIKVRCSSDDDDDDSTSSKYDDVYLDNLSLTDSNNDDVDFDFDQDKISYDIKVKKSIDHVTVTAEPEDDNYKVKINDYRVKESNDYEKRVNLEEGDNKIEVKITDDDDNERVYTLNITRGSSSSSTNTTTDDDASSTTNNNTNNNVSSNTSNDTTTAADTSNRNKWNTVKGKWQYNGDSGTPLKSQWYYDKNYNKTYYLNSNGDMETDWLQLGGKWYYLDPSGAKQTGWQQVRGNWYYLDASGIMQTSWFKDSDGKWYYLDPSTGAMLTNKVISKVYRLGSDGAWIR